MSQKETTPTINIDLSKDNEIKEGERKETMEKEWKETAREIYWEKSECWKTPSKSKNKEAFNSESDQSKAEDKRKEKEGKEEENPEKREEFIRGR